MRILFDFRDLKNEIGIEYITDSLYLFRSLRKKLSTFFLITKKLSLFFTV